MITMIIHANKDKVREYYMIEQETDLTATSIDWELCKEIRYVLHEVFRL